MTSYASALTVSKYEATFDSYVKMPKLNIVGDRLLNPWNTGLTLFFIETPNHFADFIPPAYVLFCQQLSDVQPMEVKIYYSKGYFFKFTFSSL